MVTLLQQGAAGDGGNAAAAAGPAAAHRARRLEGAHKEAAVAPRPGALQQVAAAPRAVQLAAVGLRARGALCWARSASAAVAHPPCACAACGGLTD